MTEEEFNNAIEKIFKIKLTNSTKLHFEYTFSESTFKLKKKRFREAVQDLNSFKTEDSYEIFNEKHFEVSVIRNTRFYFPGDEEICKEDSVNKIKYELSSSSDTYLIQLINQLLPISNNAGSSRPIFFHRLRHRYFNDSEKKSADMFDVLKQIIPKFQTLKITSENSKTKSEFETLCYSFLFNLSYNTDLSLLPSSIVEDLTRSIRIGRIRRAKIEEVDIPKRKYENDLEHV